MRTDTGQVVHLADYRPTDFVLERVDLTFELDPSNTKVEARLIFHRREGADKAAPLVLDGDELKLTGVLLDQIEIPAAQYDVTPESLTIRDLPEETPFEICVTNYINPQVNTQLMGLYRTNGVYCTQCEAEGFRRITYFPDRPDVLAPYTVTIIAAKEGNPLLLSNGNFLGGGNYDEGRHFAAWFDPHPKPSYLFALVAGDLGVVEDTFTTMSGNEVALKIYVEHGKEPRATYAMDALKRSMKWDEERFGREYDLNIFQIVAVSDFNMGAMENKGLNVFNDKFVLADPETATDADYANIERIIAHEYFHNWTGNRITCRDWFQLCLKEGLTVYRDQEFSSDMRSRPVKRIADVRHLKSEQFPEDSGPLAHPPRPDSYREINNFYTTTVYEKGAEVTRMIATILGAADFKKGMDLYFERHDGEAATVEDFVKSFADASGRDLTQFALWYTEAGTPLVAISADYDAVNSTFKLSLEQTISPTPGQPVKQPRHIPLSLALILDNGQIAEPKSVEGGEYRDGVLHLTEGSQSCTFTGISSRPVVSINRSFSAPVNIDFPQQPADLVQIARHETDMFARFQALTELALPALTAATKAAHAGDEIQLDADLIATLIEVADDESLEPAFRAQALALPSETDIARELGRDTDPDAIHKARNATIAAIAKAGVATFTRLVETYGDTGPYSPDAESAGRRSLRNTALTYLASAEDTPDRAADAYTNASNMTDLAHALSVLTQRFPEKSQTAEALANFEGRFADNALVLDKWFSLQAAIPGEGALERIKGLMTSKHFIPSNPNRVRSLVGTLAFANPTGFHRIDGAAYRFLAEQIIAIDARNPQLAARLLTSMRSWRALEAKRAEQARAALVQIAETKGLSADVGDIVERILKG
ncbi:aminopeptidase N [Agrobacterium tumefaciens]|uniref:aminopeptidase N n=1 Tax=Agrobacterium tumefaciens TaxID=358 RepID=UPI00287CBF79|nr:aminopeptidase N [Agrobacterium tumefaciens]MDS7596568.1 aminopeptidase N [Agrobacterium tumefaciens]